MGNLKLRSISDQENYATYLALPFLELSKYSFGEGNFINAYFTVNGNIGALVRDISDVPWKFEEHRYYRTDMPYYDGFLILFKCPPDLANDMSWLLDSKFSRISGWARELIAEYSGMHVYFPTKNGGTFTSRLYGQAIMKLEGWRSILEERLGITIPPEAELEPGLREQDILYDVDTDINFIYEEYQKGGNHG